MVSAWTNFPGFMDCVEPKDLMYKHHLEGVSSRMMHDAME
jgi:hypothetical protein